MGIHQAVGATQRRSRASLPASFTLEHDETTGTRLRKLALDPRIDELVLDGRAVRQMSPRALGLLVAVHRLTQARGARSVIVDPSPELVAFVDGRGLADLLLPRPPLAPAIPLWPQRGEMASVDEPVD